MSEPTKHNCLDWEMVCNGDEWHLWIPDTTGAILGIGKTELGAKADAVKNMEILMEILIGIKGTP